MEVVRTIGFAVLVALAIAAAFVFVSSYWRRKGWRRVDEIEMTPAQARILARQLGAVARHSRPAAVGMKALSDAFTKVGVAMRPFVERAKDDARRAKYDVSAEIALARIGDAVALYETIDDAAKQAGRMSMIRAGELTVWPSSATALAEEALALLQEARVASDKLIDIARESQPGGDGYELRERLAAGYRLAELSPAEQALSLVDVGPVDALSESDLRGFDGVVSDG